MRLSIFRSRIFMLFCLATVSFLLRFAILSLYAYPPSADAGGDLLFANSWLHGIWTSSADAAFIAPPLYYFLIVIPFTHLLPVFLAIKLMMALVPAFMVFPAYLLASRSGANFAYSSAAAFLLSMSAPFSLMLTWNSAFNLFSIFFYLFFLSSLFKPLTKNQTTRREIVLSALFLALVAATHELTFLVAMLTFTVFVTAMFVYRKSLQVVWNAIKILVFAALFSVPLLPVYLFSISQSYNVGYSASQFSIYYYYLLGIFFGWGQQGISLDPLIIIDIALMVVGLLVLLRSSDTRPFALLMLTVAGIAGIFPVFDATNEVRGLYFLAIPYCMFLVIGVSTLFNGRSDAPGSSKPSFVEHLLQNKKKLIVGALIIGLLVTNVGYSLQVLNSGTLYNSYLSDTSVAALDWIKQNTSIDASVYTSNTLQPWVEGYSGRTAFGPFPLGYDVTKASYNSSLLSDCIYLGNYVLGNQFLAVSMSFPGVGVPMIYLAVQGYWNFFLSTQPDNVNLTIKTGSATDNIALSSATLTGVSAEKVNGMVRASFQYYWLGPNISVTEIVSLLGSDLEVDWISNDSSIMSVGYDMYLPPSGYYYTYLHVPNTSSSFITDTFNLANKEFTLNVGSPDGTFSQSKFVGGWTVISALFSQNLTLSFQALSGVDTQGLNPSGYFVDSLNLLRQLNITYFVLGANTDYYLFTRIRNLNDTMAGVALMVFLAGDIQIFQIRYTEDHTSILPSSIGAP